MEANNKVLDFATLTGKLSSDGVKLFDGGIGLIYPDFIGKNPTDRVIADAKYKPIDNIGNKDYLQCTLVNDVRPNL